MENLQWGRQEILKQHECCKVKEIIIHPGKELECHLHQYHSEHWIVTKGEANVLIGNDFHVIKANQHIYIPKSVRHKISNNTNDILIMIEIQIGNYFGNNDYFICN